MEFSSIHLSTTILRPANIHTPAFPKGFIAQEISFLLSKCLSAKYTLWISVIFNSVSTLRQVTMYLRFVYLYRVILSVLDRRKCEYLKDYSLDFEQAYMTTYLASWKSMSILEEMLEMFATTVQAELNATLHVCESGLQDVLTNRSNFTSNVVFQFLYGAWLVGISFSF